MRGASLGRIAQGLWAALIGPDERPVIGVTCSRRSGESWLRSICSMISLSRGSSSLGSIGSPAP